MARISPIDRANPPAEVAQQLSAVRAKMGKVPNVLATFAHSPAALNSYLAINGAIAGGTLSAQDRERIALATAQVNGCDYCLSAHSLVGKLSGLSEAEVIGARQGRSADPRSAAIVQLAQAIVEARGRIANDQLQAARDAGLTDGEVLEVLANVVANLLTNYANNLIGTEIDFPQAPALAA
jgi:uncharacterized peroxidase-related enzyme